MPITIWGETPLPKGTRCLLVAQCPEAVPGAALWTPDRFATAAGAFLQDPAGRLVLQVEANTWLPGSSGPSMSAVWVRTLEALEPQPGGMVVHVVRQGVSLAWVTLSDKGARGEREDSSGPLIAELVSQALPVAYSQGFVLPDSVPDLQGLLHRLSFVDRFDLIFTTGGTGVAPRDITPEATAKVVEKRLPGFERAMTATSLAKTPHGMISRAIAGTARDSLLCNLPGSPKGVRENLEVLLPALGHTLDKLHDDPTDCARPE